MSDEDIASVIANFIKGKADFGEKKIAKLTWEGDVPPEMPEMPTLSASFADFGSEYSNVVTALSSCSYQHCISIFSGMLTLPELQSNTYRLELLVHLAGIHAKGKKVPTAAQVTAWFNALDQGTAGRMEDAAEDVFLTNVFLGQYNYRLFEGTSEGNAYYTQVFLDILEDMPTEGEFKILQKSIRAILTFSEQVASSNELSRNIVGNQTPVGQISKPAPNVFKNIKYRTLISDEMLVELGIDSEALTPFISGPEDFQKIKHFGPNFTPNEFKPLIRVKGGTVLALPTMVGVAVRAAVILFCMQGDQVSLLEQALANAHTRRLQKESLLGELRNVPIAFSNNDKFRASNVCTEIDAGRYLHLLLFVDHFDNFEKGAFSGYNAVEELSDFVAKSVEETASCFTQYDGFKEGISLIVGCGWGRGLALGLPENPENWRTMFLSAHDLITLSSVGDFDPLDLWRVIDAERRLNGMNIFITNGNGFLNLYSWMKSKDGHIVPHEQLDDEFGTEDRPAFLNIPLNCGLEIRANTLNARDEHVVLRPDGTPTRLSRTNRTPRYGCSELSPFYVDLYELEERSFCSVYTGQKTRFWIESCINPLLGGDTQFHLSNMVMNWAEATFRHVERYQIADYEDIWIQFKFQDNCFPKDTDIQLENEAISELVGSPEFDGKKLIVEVGEGFLLSAQRPDNFGEKMIVRALLECCLRDVNQPDNKQIDEMIEKITGGSEARHFHAFSNPDLRDYIREALPRKSYSITSIDDANNRLNLGWLVRDRKSGCEIRGRESCCGYLRKLVQAIVDRLKSNVSQYNRKMLVEKLLVNHETAMSEMERWRRTFQAVRALSEDNQKAADEATKEIAKFNATTMACRIVAEAALCHSVTQDGEIAGDYDMSYMMSDALQIFHLGGYSDAMNLGVMAPEIRISPAGDVLMNHDFTDSIIEPFGAKFQNIKLNDSADKYAENYIQTKPKNEAVADHLETDDDNYVFEQAWKKDCEISTEEILKLTNVFYSLCVQNDTTAIHFIPKDDLVKLLINEADTDTDKVEKYLGLFSFKPRLEWDTVTNEFSKTSWAPWRFQRQLSLVSRPIIQLDMSENPEFAIAPTIIVAHIVKFLSDARYGNFDTSFFPNGSALSKWMGVVNGRQGEEFNEIVAGKFREKSWDARSSLSDGELLNRTKQSGFGDVDVLAWSKEKSRVLVVECKDLSFDKTTGEIARRIAKYRGQTRSNGKGDDLLRHLNRCEQIEQSLDELSKYVGFEVTRIERVLLFSNTTPLQFADSISDKGVIMMTFSEIEKP